MTVLPLHRAFVAPVPPGSSRGSQAPDASRVTQVRAGPGSASLRVGVSLHRVTRGLSAPGLALSACWGERDPSLRLGFPGWPDAT